MLVKGYAHFDFTSDGWECLLQSTLINTEENAGKQTLIRKKATWSINVYSLAFYWGWTFQHIIVNLRMSTSPSDNFLISYLLERYCKPIGISLKHTVEFILKGQHADLWIMWTVWTSTLSDQIEVKGIWQKVKRNEGLSCLRKTKANATWVIRTHVLISVPIVIFLSHSLKTISPVGLH